MVPLIRLRCGRTLRRHTAARVAPKTALPRGRLRLAKALGLSLLLLACENPVQTASSGSVWVTPSGQTVKVGATIRVYATGFSSSGGSYALGNVTWSSSDESIATVSLSSSSILGDLSEATVVGVSEGAATITATTARAGAGSVGVTVIP
jgi:hypothetical protein